MIKTPMLCNIQNKIALKSTLESAPSFFFFSFQQLAGNLDDFRIAKTEQKTETIERIISNQSYGWVKLPATHFSSLLQT